MKGDELFACLKTPLVCGELHRIHQQGQRLIVEAGSYQGGSSVAPSRHFSFAESPILIRIHFVPEEIRQQWAGLYDPFNLQPALLDGDVDCVRVNIGGVRLRSRECCSSKNDKNDDGEKKFLKFHGSQCGMRPCVRMSGSLNPGCHKPISGLNAPFNLNC